MPLQSTAQVTFLTSASLLAAFIAGHFINTSKLKHCPQSTASILVGGILGVAVFLIPIEASLFHFDPEFFYFFLLPPIVLEAGFSLDRPNFLHNIGPILWFAVVGTLVSAYVLAEGAFLLGPHFGLTGSDGERRAYCWLLGSLLSAVDPVATLSIMGGSRFAADERLFSIVFGESILNDAVAIVLFKTVEKLFFVDKTAATAISVLLEVGRVTAISVIVGLAAGFVAYVAFRVSKGLRKFPEYELGLLLLVAYFAFGFSEILRGSGILTLFLVGALLGHYNLRNLSPTSQSASVILFKVLAVLSESCIYILFGVIFASSLLKRQSFSSSCIVLSFALTLLGRACSVFPSCAVINSIYRCAWKLKKPAEAEVPPLFRGQENQRSTSSSPMASSPCPTVMARTQSSAYRVVRPVSISPSVFEQESFVSRQTYIESRSMAIEDFEGGSYSSLNGADWQDTTGRNLPDTNDNPQLAHQSVLHMASLMSGSAGSVRLWTAHNKCGLLLDNLTASSSVYLSFGCQFILWLSGLRGAIAFALALSLPLYHSAAESSKFNQQTLISTTLAIVILTTVILGGCIEVFALRLGIMKRVDTTDITVADHSPTNLGIGEESDTLEDWPPTPQLIANQIVQHMSRLTRSDVGATLLEKR